MDHSPEDGCHFHLRFQKSRAVKGDAVAAVDVRLEDMADGPTWTCKPLEESTRERVEQMLTDGMTPQEIATELEVRAVTSTESNATWRTRRRTSNDAPVDTTQHCNASVPAPENRVCTGQ